MTDIGICHKCGGHKCRVQVATPGDQFNAELWGNQRFEVIRREDGR